LLLVSHGCAGSRILLAQGTAKQLVGVGIFRNVFGGKRLKRVERSLYQRGLGYNYEATKIFMPAGSKQPVVVHYIEHCPPDVGAAFIWLKNRDPERWRDVQNVKHVLGKYLISDRPMTPEQWAAERATIIDEKVVEELPAPTGRG
jgi:hypothetical protein